MSIYPSIVLAGNRTKKNNVEKKKPTCLTPVNGIPAITRVVSSLRKSKNISTITLVGLDDEKINQINVIKEIRDYPETRFESQDSSPSKSALKALKAMPPPALLTTGDHALLTPELINLFCLKATQEKGDFIAGLVPFKRIKQKYPNTRRTKLNFKDGSFCGCNLFLLKSTKAIQVLQFWVNIEKNRKNPLKIAMQLGIIITLRYLTKTLSLKSCLNEISNKCEAVVNYVELEDPKVAIDVDSEDDLQLAELILKKEN